jgi:hypothetical protein
MGGQIEFLLLKICILSPLKRKQRVKNSYPKRMSGLGVEGLEERKEMIVWANAVEIAERRGEVWKEPALKK